MKVMILKDAETGSIVSIKIVRGQRRDLGCCFIGGNTKLSGDISLDLTCTKCGKSGPDVIPLRNWNRNICYNCLSESEEVS